MPADKEARALDRLALMLGTAPEWDSDMLESIALIVSSVRPNVGDSADTYVADFIAARGFDPTDVPALRDFITDQGDY